MTSTLETSVEPRRLADRDLHRLLQSFIQRRVPQSEVDDLVQTVLCDALAARRAPATHEDLRRWLVGIARHKIADHYRTAGRERPTESPQISVDPSPYEARAMVRWAERAASTEYAPSETLEWMAREGEGESLATIADEHQVPAARVRQRVSRLRRTLKQRWLGELAVVVAITLMALGAWQWWTGISAPTAIEDTPHIEPDGVVEQARALRDAGLRACEQAQWPRCLELLDRAEALDEAGDRIPAIGSARRRATEALSPTTPAPTVNPSASTEPTAPNPSASSMTPSTIPTTPSTLDSAPPGPISPRFRKDASGSK